MTKHITVGDTDLDFDTAVALSKAASEAATRLGYCSESANVVRKMGLPVETVKVSIEFVVNADKYHAHPEAWANPDYWTVRQDYTGMSTPVQKVVTVGKPKFRVVPE